MSTGFESSAAGASTASQPASERVLSVDALRGFDMFWIIGAGLLVQALDKMSGNGVTNFLSTQLKHVDWEGFRFYDLIFPLFLFLMGVSIVFSLDRVLARDGLGGAVRRILRRSVLLFVLGMIYYGGVLEKWPNIKLAGVLQRIAACYLFAALIYVFCAARLKAMGGIAGALLVGYWALVTFVPFPDLKLEKETVAALAKQAGSDSPFAIAGVVTNRVNGLYEESRNLPNFLDFLFLRGRKLYFYYDNEGLLSTLPSIAICLCGVFGGRLLKNERVEPKRKVGWLLGAGVLLLLLGFSWSLQFPLIKRIWSSSFCLVASGYAALLLAAFYYIVDVRKSRKWCQPLVWIGTNSITIYLAVNIVAFPRLAERFVGGDVKAFLDAHVAPGFGGLVVALTALALAVLLCWFLHRKNLFLRV